jgi:S-adenosyl methyltransferase
MAEREHNEASGKPDPEVMQNRSDSRSSTGGGVPHRRGIITWLDRAPAAEPVEIDPSVAHASRMYDYLLGGTDNFAADREAVEHAAAAVGGIDNARADVRANRAFLGRAVHYLAGDAGIRQFLDIGTGIPNPDNVHGLAQATAPESRIVYVDNDPVVLAHAHTLLNSTPQGSTAYISCDLRDPDTILDRAAATFDFTQPVAVILVAILHLISDRDQPHRIVERLVEALPSGSYLAMSHLSADIQPDAMAELARRLNQAARETFVMRTHAQVSCFFDGLDLVEPGVVQVDHWRPPKPSVTTSRGWVPSLYAAVGRTP